MAPFRKTLLILLLTSHAGIAVFVAAWCLFGFIPVLCLTGILFVICALAVLPAVGKPFILSRKLYAKEPPRALYDRISSKPGYCRLADMPEYMATVITGAEDSKFFSHRGINWGNIIHAAARNIFTDAKPVGGSSISQQLIKNAYLTPEATMRRKITEFFMVGRLERELSKNEILELYLNIIYYGHGKYGIAAASEFYYNCPPRNLSFDQCVSLAAVLPCPDKYNKFASPLYFSQMRQSIYLNIGADKKNGMTFDELAHSYVEGGD